MSYAELFHRHIANAGRPAEEQDLSVYTEDFVAEFPYAPQDHTGRLEGPAAISRFLANIGNFADSFAYGEPTIVGSGDTFVAEYTGDSRFKSTGRPYNQQYITVFQVRDGQISGIREYYDPMRVLRAMGEID